MSEHPTREQIARVWGYWIEYVDPAGTMTEEEFDNLSLAKKLEIQEECFGPEWDEEEEG